MLSEEMNRMLGRSVTMGSYRASYRRRTATTDAKEERMPQRKNAKDIRCAPSGCGTPFTVPILLRRTRLPVESVVRLLL